MTEAVTNWDDGSTFFDAANTFWDFTNERPPNPALPPAAGTVYIPFLPSSSANFQFQATFDGAICTMVVTWSLFGQRYYVNIYDTSGTLVVALPLIGSPPERNISLTAGYFTTSLVYREQSKIFEVFG